MNISFPINKLLGKELTPNDFTIGILLKEKKYGLLKTFAKKEKTFYESIKRLKENNYISFTIKDGIIPLKEIIITEDFDNIISNGDNFEEFYNLYPTKVNRPNGQVDYLRVNKNKCKIRYKRLVNNNLMKHDHIMDCLKYEIEKRTKQNNMAYFQRMYNYLISENWKKYEEELQELAEKEVLSNKIAKQYGTELL
jgi:hypothetical protein